MNQYVRPTLFAFAGLWIFALALPARGQVPSAHSSRPQEADRSPARDSVLLGVVWTPPDAPGPALRELNRLHASGVTAVRLTALPPADTIFARADTLGLRLFVDLPVSYAPAPALQDSLSRVQRTLGRLRTLAGQHSSVQYVGLARHADTSVPEACSVLVDWSTRLHSSPSRLQTYYVTPFRPSADQCAGAVDLRLLDTRTHPHPVSRWARGADTTRTGLGALGTWVHPNAERGLRVPHSPERQARYLERALTTMLDSVQTKPPAVFVYRWQDRAAPPLPFRRFGLHDRSGAPRPSADVVEGFYTGTQRVFAFPAGASPPAAPHGLILFGWGLLALLAGLYAQSPFVKQTAFRYFVAHGFYRDAVAEGRNVAAGINTTLLLLVAAAVGSIALLLTRIAAASPATEHVVAALPQPISGPLVAGLVDPRMAGVVGAGLTLALLVGWALTLVLLAPWKTNFSVSQGVMLVTWPCWPVLIGLIVALVTATQPSASPAFLSALVVGGGVWTIVSVTVRVLRDYWDVTGVSFLRVLVLAVPSPLLLTTGAWIALARQYDLPLSFLWHLLTHT